MFQKLVSRNPDIERLLKRGYSISFDAGYLIVRDIPYLGPEKQLNWGAIVCKLDFVDETSVRQDNHQIWFAGGSPHGLDGKPIPLLGDASATLPLGECSKDVIVERRFSNKPKSGAFADHYEKVDSYVAIISGPAMSDGVDPYRFRAVEVANPHPVFKLQDTLTSRAGIGDLNGAFSEDVVAIVGLGGTGSYVLDFLARTPVKEVRLFDGDEYHVHNAFRSPGRLAEGDLGRKKAAVYAERFEGFRHGVSYEATNIDSENGHLLDGVSLAFVCVDKGSARKEIHSQLRSRSISYIDVGMGLRRKGGKLRGMCRTTLYQGGTNLEPVDALGLVQLVDGPDDEYKENIQVAELNALNAALAIIRYKQLRGFYADDVDAFNLLFSVSDYHNGVSKSLDDAD